MHLRRVTFGSVSVAVLLVISLTLLLSAGSVPTAKPEEVGMSADRLGRIGEAFQQHIDAHDISGAIGLVARRGKIAYFEAQGVTDIESKRVEC